jgi:hypothetical protein
VSDTVGTTFVEILIVREVDVAVAPRLSVATAVSTCVPTTASVQFAVYGLATADPTSVAPA